MRFHKPIGFLLLLWPTLWALWIAANNTPSATTLSIFIAGVIVMRAAGCVINDIHDRKIDPHVARTKSRPLAAGTVSITEAWGILLVLAIIAFALVLLLHPFTILLSLGGALLAFIYPLAKRFFPIPQFFLGVAFSWSILMAFSEEIQQLPLISWLLFLAACCWTIAYDTQYALADRADDLRINVKSSAIFFGRHVQLWIGLLQSTMLTLLVVIGWIEHANLSFYIMLSIATGLMLYQHYLTRHTTPEKCLQAFINNNWVGAIIFLGIVLNVG